MSTEFNEEQQFNYAPRRAEVSTRPAMVKLIMKMGVKSEAAANYWLVGIGIFSLILGISIYFHYNSYSAVAPKQPPRVTHGPSRP